MAETVYYCVVTFDIHDNASEHSPYASIMVTSILKENKDIPTKFALYPNYPNPFNSTTTIRYDLPKPSRVQLIIFNLLGQNIRTLVDENQQSGRYTIKWNGQDERGLHVSSGIYYVKIRANTFINLQKMVLLQ